MGKVGAHGIAVRSDLRLLAGNGAVGIDKLKEYIKTIGLFNNKAKSIMALSKDLVDKYGITAKLWKASPGSDAKQPTSS